jgi:hypothetical protein
MAKISIIRFPSLKGVQVPSPIYEQFRKARIAALAATLTEVLNLRHLNESLNGNECHLGFREQCQIVWDGFRKGVKYDGCTGVPDFDFGADCCGEHDYHYQIGDVSRAEADKRLRQCLRKKGYFVLPWAYWLGVRLLGWKFYKRKR